MATYEPIIGLEVHVELGTVTKMFCGCSADHFGKPPNTQTCPVCLGLPGALPVPNKKAIEWTMMLGLALGCSINEQSKFDRKNYFYPDLAKGYQISQYDEPLAVNGRLEIPNSKSQNSNEVRIRRVHIEEDTGKLQHATVGGAKLTLVDFNRSGVPLVEIVTEPDFRSVEEVDIYVKKLQQIVRYTGISAADMEKGTMRLEPSISLRVVGETSLPGYRVELKNINSFRFARKGLEYEIARQTELLERGETPTQQTRGWSEAKNATVAQREKEDAHDYRYFPEPDIPPMRFTQESISALKANIPELPDEKKQRFMKSFALNDYDATLLVETQDRAHYFEQAVTIADTKVQPKILANWLINKKVDPTTVTPQQFVDKILSQAAKKTTLSPEALGSVVSQVVAENPKAIADYRSGKEAALMFVVGQVMKQIKGAATADTVKQVVVETISK